MRSYPDQILVLEDSPAFQKVIKQSLSQAGFQVTVASQAVEAFRLAKQVPFDLIISDYYLPDYPGTDFVKHLRELGGYKHVPVILVTARAEELNVARLSNELQVLVFPKPCSMQLLRDTVCKCLAIARSTC